MVAALRVWESFYCEGSFERCERYRLHQSGREIPGRLLPNGRLLDDFSPGTASTSQPSLKAG
jgi:hypothetical protein